MATVDLVSVEPADAPWAGAVVVTVAAGPSPVAVDDVDELPSLGAGPGAVLVGGLWLVESPWLAWPP